MRHLTQSSLDPGNCWQTAVACILDLEAEALPSQVAYDVPTRTRSGWGSYQNILNGYLGKHHGLVYDEINEHILGGIDVRDPGWHLMVGPTVRTEEHRAAGRQHVLHAMVGHRGEAAWDPHPSRAGLTRVQRWGVLAPLPSSVREHRLAFADELVAKGRDDAADYRRVFIDCLCPACGGER